MGKWPPGLSGPVELQLARAVEQLPGERAMPGGSRYEMKLDGFRLAPVCRAGQVRLWSRQGRDLSNHFPDVRAALATQVQRNCVIDGEVCSWDGQRLSFERLQRRLAAAPATARRLVVDEPASFVAFDLLALDDADLRPEPWTARREHLETLAESWSPPLQLSPVTADVDEARDWLTAFRSAGVEGLVIKGAGSRYAPGRRDWFKLKSRESRDLILGAVTGSLDRPQVIVAGRYLAGELVIVGRTVPLSPRQAAEIAPLLRPAGPSHPWPDQIGSGRWGGQGTTVPLLRVQPTVVIEVTADAAMHGGQYRHPLRYIRHRPDLEPGDLDGLDLN